MTLHDYKGAIRGRARPYYAAAGEARTQQEAGYLSPDLLVPWVWHASTTDLRLTGTSASEKTNAMLVPSAASLSHLENSAYVRFSLLALSSIFFLVDPFAALPTFLAVTADQDPAKRVRTARKASLTALVILCAFAAAGQFIFRLFGITLPAFEIAGGIILLLIGLDMLEAKRSATQESSGDTQEAATKDDAGIVPMGIPMLAGPGAITSVMVLVGQALNIPERIAIYGAIVITCAASFLVLGSAVRVARALGDTGIRILVRIMGLMLVALAVQDFVNGLADLGVLNKP